MSRWVDDDWVLIDRADAREAWVLVLKDGPSDFNSQLDGTYDSFNAHMDALDASFHPSVLFADSNGMADDYELYDGRRYHIPRGVPSDV